MGTAAVRPSLSSALGSSAGFGVRAGRQLSPSLRVRQLPPPTTAPAGDLQCVAGLLLARAAPFDRVVHAVIWAGWGHGQVTAGERQACQSRTREARQRLCALARTTPIPACLLTALAAPQVTDPLVLGLAALYDLTPRARRGRPARSRPDTSGLSDPVTTVGSTNHRS